MMDVTDFIGILVNKFGKFHTSNKTKRKISLIFNTNINWNKHTINKTILQKIDKFNV